MEKNNAGRVWAEFFMDKFIKLSKSYNAGEKHFGIEKNEEIWKEILSQLTTEERKNFMAWIKEISDALD